ncbi:MAG: 3-deoxy-D-manno-octulosonic acid transferase [Phycisphaerae bacterium]|nr:3-deoxy-D-manno-octulosonic acid transferase [Phycisphaerae bacterium]
MFNYVLDMVYLAGLAVTSPVWAYRMFRHGRYRRGLAQRLGAAPIRYGLQPVIWVNGVSLGEVRAAAPLINELHSQLPDYRVVVSSWTDTGMDEARRAFAPDHTVFARPVDFSCAVARSLRRVRPDLVVLIEGDIWPNFLRACNRRSVPVVVVNGRMSPDKGYPRYKKMGSLGPRLLFNRLAALGVQNEEYARRFIDLGTDASRVHVTGMMKFDRPVGDFVEGQEALSSALRLAVEPLIVAGGTGEGEEALVLDAFVGVRRRVASARLAIVPRKPERFDEVARLIAERGFGVVRRTQRPDGSGGAVDPQAVILGDTMGELRKYYALADAVFVGRSLLPQGGSDMIESAALGKPTCFGPHTYNFPQAEELAVNGCARVADKAALQATLEHWLTDSAAATAAGKKAQSFVARQQGATRRNVEMICRVLGRTPAVTPGAIATDEVAAKP